ncbi:MAG TPA: alpha/beta hydrolase [Stellaceae bacterium]|nr:alpha/beta hydrolase [Stellaceae bacterium]
MIARLPEPLAEIAIESADGAVLRVRRHGNPLAATRLFLSHGNGFAIDGYIHFWSRLLAEFDIVAFNMRSHGRNPRVKPANHDYAHMVQDIDAVGRAVRAEFGRKASAGLFHSMSAQSALLQTIAGPVHFDALIAFDPPNVPIPGHPVRDAMVGYEHKLANWASDRRTFFADPEELAADFAATRSGQCWTCGADIAMARAVLRQGGEGWELVCPRECEASVYLQGIDLGLWPRRQDVPIPVALIGADPDRPYPAATALSNRALAREGGFDYRAIPGTSHLLQLEEPAACAEAALSALARLRIP